MKATKMMKPSRRHNMFTYLPLTKSGKNNKRIQQTEMIIIKDIVVKCFN
jgi:hypothetical protein